MNWLLSAIVFLPLVGGDRRLLLPERLTRWTAAICHARRLRALSLWLYIRPADHGQSFGDVAQPGVVGAATTGSTSQSAPSTSSFDYALGTDGLSMPMIILNGLLTFLAVVGSWHIEKRHQVLHGDDALPGVRRDGRLRRLRPLPLLPLLGGRADPDVPAHRHLGRRAARVRGLEVPDLHLHRLSLYAGGHLPALLPDWRRQRRVRVSLVASRAEQGRRHAAVLRRWQSRCRWCSSCCSSSPSR